MKEYQKKLCVVCLFALGVLFLTMPAQATTIYWANWTGKNFGLPGSATGIITFPGSSVDVTYTGELLDTGDQGDWNYSSYTLPGTVDNQPTPNNVSIQLMGGNSIVDTITFSQPVLNPVMAIQSLGAWGADQAEYDFTSSFTLLNSGDGHWGGGSLVQSGNNLSDIGEGNGIIQFLGTFSSISWTVPDGENYHMFTVGAPATASVPEPSTLLLIGVGLAGVGMLRRRFNS